MPSPNFAEGSDASALAASLDRLLSGDRRWTLTTTGDGIERTFKFKTFAKTWDFMTAVSLQCKIKNHHPEWSNVYNTTFIRWTTHNPKGLSARDLELAALCDSIGKDFGEIIEPQLADAAAAEAAPACTLQGLATSAVTGAGGNCCGPPPKKSGNA